MRILYILTGSFDANYPRDQNYIIKYMSERNHNVILITGKNIHAEKFDTVIFPKVTISRFFNFRIRRLNFFASPRSFQKIISVKCDIVHTFTFFTLSSALGVLAKVTRSARSSIIRSEVGPPYIGENFKKARILKPLLLLIKRNYDAVTVYNDIEAESLRLLGFPDEKIIKLPPMIDFSKFSKLSKDESKTSIVNIGTMSRLTPSKGIHFLIPLLRDLCKTKSVPNRFILAGRIENKPYASRILIELRKILGEKFYYLGEVADPLSFYKRVDVVIIPTLYETGAISVLEALAAGKVILAHNIYPINLYIKDSFNAFLYNNLEEAKKKLTFILDNFEHLKQIKFNANETAKMYDYNHICASLEKEYYKLAGP